MLTGQIILPQKRLKQISASTFIANLDYVAYISRLRRSLVRACTPLTKPEEKERLLAVYLLSSYDSLSRLCCGTSFYSDQKPTCSSSNQWLHMSSVIG